VRDSNILAEKLRQRYYATAHVDQHDTALVCTFARFQRDLVSGRRCPPAAWLWYGPDGARRRAAALYQRLLHHLALPCLQAQLPKVAAKLPHILVLEGSGVKIAPRWVVEKAGGREVQGCRVTIQMSCDLFMAHLPTAIMNFVFKVQSKNPSACLRGASSMHSASHLSFLCESGDRLHVRFAMRMCDMARALTCCSNAQSHALPYMTARPQVLSPLVYRLAKYVIVSNVRRPGAPLHARVQQNAAFYDQAHRDFSAHLHARPGADVLYL
jgi:hypothetical protein